ncbi:competence type IV pilus major pilin ComGC [Ornithinibacillus halophilus]|uniref:ComG operon protein 3 n=1 Tax=Ornithinibacillus halophilus TaxID=930117 RepID=A0A1M5D0X5_9BACI|nr:competence type IV pilus major pilin ComGC [Ornithinibacillus halophilus]SHF60683.1 competence protein ComGC [Ornithinibacillus halophilus]
MFKNNKGFTLIEMLLVLMIISVLMILIIPNLGEKGKKVAEDGCDALVSLVQAQSDTYLLENGSHAKDLDSLVSAEYITSDQTKCKNGTELIYNNGKVTTPNSDD